MLQFRGLKVVRRGQQTRRMRDVQQVTAKSENRSVSRREFLRTTAIMAAGVTAGCSSTPTLNPASGGELILDIHQHLDYHHRTDEQFVTHQWNMGVNRTILLPAGRPVDRPSTNNGVSNGLEATCGGNERCFQFAREHGKAYLFGANEVPDLPDAISEIERYLKRGAVVIAEQKFHVECDSAEMQRIYSLAAHYNVPVLMHWQFERFNTSFEQFYKMLEKFPRTRFVGHAQTWWANINKDYSNWKDLYPKGKVTPGGITDRYLSDYPNMFGDLSAGSGLNALRRDEDHARDFLHRHQNKLIYGSDCDDLTGLPDKCQGAQTIAMIRMLVPESSVRRKLFWDNAKRVFRV